MLVIALITGLSSFIYEIGWIRMLSLVLGSSTHSFELMLSAFLLGLALGGLWIRKRIDAAASPERFLAIVQILMGAFALASLPLYNYTFDAMLWLLQSVQRNNGGYLLFNLTSHVIAMVVMLPTTFCAGMTLPLITYALLRQGHGERSIGAVYGANTAGAIAGIFLAVHLAMPILGLTGLITLGAALDILLGLVLIWRAHRTKSTPSRRVALTWTTAGVLAITATSLFAGIDPLKRASGVYRTGALLEPSSGTEVVYHRDGKTASVDVLHVTPPSTLSIRTNGKTDASVQIDGKGASLDEPTMILAAALPMLYHPRAQSVAVIGMGSGLTSNTFLRNPSVARVDTIEIEQAMVAGARKFLPRNELVYTDPRSRVHIEDAKTFFSTHKSQYDIIASEPSNPWVSGVSSLFTDEFYGQVRRHLNDDGLLVQWIQVYEIDTRLVMTVLKALSRNFSDYAIYTSGHTDTIIVAKKNGALGSLDFERHVALGLGNDLGHIEVRNTYDVWLRKVGSRRFLQPLVESWPIPYNSDYFPILDQNAVRTRFLDQRAYELVELPNAQLPLLEMLGGEQPPRDHVSVSPTSAVLRTNSAAQALALLNYVANGSLGSTPAQLNVQLARNADYLRFAAGSCSYLSRSTHWEEIMFAQSALVNTYLSRSNAVRFWSVSGFDRCRPHMTDQQRKWYSLHKAVAARDAVSMARLAREMLADSTPRGDARGSYLLSAGMLGYLASGAKPEARALWNEYSARVLGDRTPDLSLRLLVAHTLAQS
jgi:spermidine synthase